MQNVCLVTTHSFNEGVWTPGTRDKAGVLKNIFTTEKKPIYMKIIKRSFYWPVLNVQCSTTVVVA